MTIVLLLLICFVARLLAWVALARRAVGALGANRARGHGLTNPAREPAQTDAIV